MEADWRIRLCLSTDYFMKRSEKYPLSSSICKEVILSLFFKFTIRVMIPQNRYIGNRKQRMHAMLCCRIWPAKVMIDVKINCAQSTCKKDKSMKRIKCFLLSYSTSWTACFIGQNFQFSIKTKLESVASVDSPYNFRLHMEAKRRRRWKFNLGILRIFKLSRITWVLSFFKIVFLSAKFTRYCLILTNNFGNTSQ